MKRPLRASSCCDASACCPPDCCPEVKSIRARPLLDRSQRRRLALLFKVLANDTRLRLLHVLIKSGELAVNDISAALEMTPQAVSNQLQKLAMQQIVETRRAGNSIYYRVVDPCVTMLLDRGLCLLEYPKSRRKRRSSVRTPS